MVVVSAPAGRPRCDGVDPNLFASTEMADHLQARTYCDACPAVDWCLEEYRDQKKRAMPGQGPVGTWGGRLYYKTGAACGTDSGYYRHRRQGEPACEPCRQAHNATNQRRAEASRLPDVADHTDRIARALQKADTR